ALTFVPIASICRILSASVGSSGFFGFLGVDFGFFPFRGRYFAPFFGPDPGLYPPLIFSPLFEIYFSFYHFWHNNYRANKFAQARNIFLFILTIIMITRPCKT
ncbi:MAG: hypothetical protein ABIJ57_12335, partial [Pseudomonadota bacterium]